MSYYFPSFSDRIRERIRRGPVNKKYNRSVKGKKRNKKYNESDKRKESRRKYDNNNKHYNCLICGFESSRAGHLARHEASIKHKKNIKPKKKCTTSKPEVYLQFKLPEYLKKPIGVFTL